MTHSRSVFNSPIGPLTLLASDRGLVGILWPHESKTKAPSASPGAKAKATLKECARQLKEYFQGARTGFDLALDPQGSDFDMKVWKGLGRIRYGATQSYGALATALGRPKAARAVGGATGRNPIPIVVPCHRLVGADGSLTGFSGGMGAKKWLLELESGARKKHGL